MVVCEHVDRFMTQPTGPHKSIAVHQSWNLQVYLLQVLHLFIWNVTLLLTGGPSIKQLPVLF